MTNSNFRKLTNVELGLVIRLTRELRSWTQEQLAEISELSIRTIQRIEKGGSASFDTCRALARALDLQDIDYFNKPQEIPTVESQEKIENEFDCKTLMIETSVIYSGKQFIENSATCWADYLFLEDNLPSDVQEIIAHLVDQMRDYRDVASFYSELQKIKIYGEFDEYIQSLNRKKYSVVVANRKTVIKVEPLGKSFPVEIIYISVFEKGSEPRKIVVPKNVDFTI